MSALTILMKQKSVSEAKKLTQDDILKTLGGLPEEELQSTEIALKTLNKALLAREKNTDSP
jgi:NifU-like protein involved in Fe-S cluster formation